MTRYPPVRTSGKWRNDATKRCCPLCRDRPQTLKHVLSNCSATVSDRLKWRHNKVLEVIRDGLQKANEGAHVWADEIPPSTQENAPAYIADHIMAYRPDISVETEHGVFIVELTVPHEDNLQKRHEDKMRKYRLLPLLYSDRTAGKPVTVICVEVGARGMLNTSWKELDDLLGKHKKATRSSVTQTAIYCSQYLFYKRNDVTWLPPGAVDGY